MSERHSEINGFFVDVFYNILRSEEKALAEISDGRLSLKEIHVIEAVCNAAKTGKNTMGELAETLKVTTGTLTVAINTLVGKGYLARSKDGKDKRTVRILPCEKSEQINNLHMDYHHRMVQAMMDGLSGDQLESVMKALKILKDFFL